MDNAVIIGGGFYGAAIAIYLIKERKFSKVTLIERESSLLSRSSYVNQARVHNGYHYPRSFTTAFRSRVNFPRFVREFPACIKSDFTKLYAIARKNSKVTSRQFERFCRDIGAKLDPASESLRVLFEPRLIEAVFLAEEYVFDATQLGLWAQQEMDEAGVEVRLNTEVKAIRRTANGLAVDCVDIKGETEITTRFVFNCTYSGLNQLGGDFPGTHTKLKQEITEMPLVNVPPALSNLGITVMDGPFFSLMPFPPRGLHTLSHVRYTPHTNWEDRKGIDPNQRLKEYSRETRAQRMIRDVSRYLPAIADAHYVDSLFEVKTILVKNESDDGRPILYERHNNLPGCYSILGGKIDNIYDVIEKLQADLFLQGQ